MPRFEIEGFGDFADDMEDFAESIANIKRRIPRAIDRGMGDTVHDMADTMRRDVPERTGKTRRSIEVHHHGLYQWEITAGEAAVYLEYGTDSHVIEADSAEALRFQWPDAPPEVYERFAGTFPIVFFKKTEHPGTSPQKFFFPSIRKHQNELGENVFREIEVVVNQELS